MAIGDNFIGNSQGYRENEVNGFMEALEGIYEPIVTAIKTNFEEFDGVVSSSWAGTDAASFEKTVEALVNDKTFENIRNTLQTVIGNMVVMARDWDSFQNRAIGEGMVQVDSYAFNIRTDILIPKTSNVVTANPNKDSTRRGLDDEAIDVIGNAVKQFATDNANDVGAIVDSLPDDTGFDGEEQKREIRTYIQKLKDAVIILSSDVKAAFDIAVANKQAYDAKDVAASENIAQGDFVNEDGSALERWQ